MNAWTNAPIPVKLKAFIIKLKALYFSMTTPLDTKISFPTDLPSFIQAQLQDAKAQDITSLDVTGITDITDLMVICTGTSNRHVKAIADRVMANAKLAGFELVGFEGEQDCEWVLVDLGDAIVHVMQQSAREHYQLEDLWR